MNTSGRWRAARRRTRRPRLFRFEMFSAWPGSSSAIPHLHPPHELTSGGSTPAIRERPWSSQRGGRRCLDPLVSCPPPVQPVDDWLVKTSASEGAKARMCPTSVTKAIPTPTRVSAINIAYRTRSGRRGSSTPAVSAQTSPAPLPRRTPPPPRQRLPPGPTHLLHSGQIGMK